MNFAVDRQRLQAALPYLAIVVGFWCFVTLSNVLYAQSMSVGLAEKLSEQVFVGPSTRVLQHLILFLPLLAAYAASFWIGWNRPWLCVPLQTLLALAFGIAAQPALGIAEHLCSEPMLGMKGEPHDWSKIGAADLGIWSASAIHFLLTYGFGLALLIGFYTYRRYRDAEVRASTVQRAWSSARLAALRMQLSPHTLFNLLHLIRGEINWDPKSAQTMIVQLADLLRRLLNAGEQEFSRLKDELQFVTLYLELQQKRFADRLTLELPRDNDVAIAWIPSLILQPLVENAIVHGLAGHEGPVRIGVSVGIEEGKLRLCIDNSIGVLKTAAVESIGLKNVRERLAVHFGAAASFRSEPVDASTWRAEIQMPWLKDKP
jgi:hypothetical protein